MRTLKEHIDIQADEDIVWSVLDDFGGVARWAPYVRSAVLLSERPKGVGSFRSMRHFWGFRLEEDVIDWEDHKGYTFRVVTVPYPIGDVIETWSIEAGNPHVTVTSMVRYGMRMGAVGALFDWLMLRFVIRREMRCGLKGLKRYVESGQTDLRGLSSVSS